MNAPLNGKLVTVFGGSGFIGRQVVRSLARRGWRVRAAVRRPDLGIQLMPYGAVGQIQSVQANLRPEYRWSVERAIQNADAVVNLVGILAPSGKQSFAAVHDEGAGIVAECAKAAGVSAFVQMSALGANAESGSEYARTKAAGEAKVLAAFPEAVIVRPSIVFGQDDSFFNKFAAMAASAPALPLIGGGQTKFQPVYVVDVAEAIANAVEGHATAGATYELGGPEVMTFKEILELVLRETHRSRLLLPIPFAAATLLAKATQFLPKAPLTADQVTLLKSDSIVSPAAAAAGLTLAGLGITPHTVEAIVPAYLWRFRERGQFDRRTA
jgi:NADH dehydrogenase